MSVVSTPNAITNAISLHSIRKLNLPALECFIDAMIPGSQLPSADFLDDLSLTGRTTVLKLCLLCWKATEAFERRIVPREFQLRAALATVTKKNSVVDVGTGYGKTLAMILPHLLLPDKVSVVLSPYKRLQEQQKGDFASYGIRAIVINEDTPQDDGLWKVRSPMVQFSILKLLL
jgi:hypothetical protein